MPWQEVLWEKVINAHLKVADGFVTVFTFSGGSFYLRFICDASIGDTKLPA